MVAILLLNSFVFKFFSMISLSLFLFFVLVIFKFLFGFEKDRHRYVKNIILEIIIVLIFSFIVYYLFGLVIGFSGTSKYHNFYSLFHLILPLVFYICVKEYLRFSILVKASLSKFLIVLVCILFIFIDCSTVFSMGLTYTKETFLVIALSLMSAISENILCTFIALNFGYKPNIVYLLIVKLYVYLLPIVPNPSEYVYSMIYFIFPLLVLFHLKRWLFKANMDEDVTSRSNRLVLYFPIFIFVIFLVYFISGYFKYYMVAVATGSMVPKINKGDVVIVNQRYDKSDLKKGVIIAYDYNGKIVVHRIHHFVKGKSDVIIYTKGDANSSVDGYKITLDMVIGTVNFKIPFIGYPTVWINESWR